MPQNPILKVENVKTYFPVGKSIFSKKKYLKAVNDVSFEVGAHETFGLVGESGCGKSTLGRTIVRIYEPTEGKVFYKDQDVASMKGESLKQFRKEVQMIFQDPYASLNARMTVGEIIREPMDIHNLYGSRKERDEKVSQLLETVGLKPDHIRRYPHEFSGGQRQRIS
ncbi:MAG: ABC transporter ATP-binding protein, partial [Clostridia bacterium]|nr:ABC transporter ATP-binding protein [Clostridia bacterium]